MRMLTKWLTILYCDTRRVLFVICVLFLQIGAVCLLRILMTMTMLEELCYFGIVSFVVVDLLSSSRCW